MQFFGDPDDEFGRRSFSSEIEILAQHGYSPPTPAVDGGHVHVGRLLLTAGFSIFAGKGGIRSDGTITVTFQKATDIQPAATNSTSQPAAVDPLVQLEKLGQLRDDGVLTAEEFESKKADLLSRL